MKFKKTFFFIFIVLFFQSFGNVGAVTEKEINDREKLNNLTIELQQSKENRDNSQTDVQDNCKTEKDTPACQTYRETLKDNLKTYNDLQIKQTELNKVTNSTNVEQARADLKCESSKTIKQNEANGMIGAGQNDHLDGDMGTSAMKNCMKITMNSMRYLHGKHKKNEIDLSIITDASVECLESNCSKDSQENTTKKAACDQIKKDAARCDAAAYLISTYDHDWENTDQVVTKDVKGGNPPITCKGMGIATIDYESCVKFVQNGDIMDVAQGAIYTGQQLYYQDKTMTAQMNASASPNSATAGLEALHTGVKGQEDIMIQRAALDTGKFAALASYYAEMPTVEDLKGKCKNYEARKNKGLENLNLCDTVAAQQHTFGFLMNQDAKEQMKAKMVKVGIDVASDGVMAALMAKRANDIKNAITKVETFKPIDPLAPTFDNAQTTFCQQNPGDPKCLTGGLNKTFDAMSDNIITFGEGGTGASFNNNPLNDPSAISPDSGAAGAASNGVKIGSIVGSNQQKDGLQDHSAAATITKGTAPNGGGSGGGGGGGGVGSGGGGGLPAPQPQGGTSAAIQGKTPSYAGGSGTLSMMGGYGINKNRGGTKDDSNPFAKLFNKDGSKSGVLNFDGRSPASLGPKSDNLFKMISKRYTTVSGDKRLIEYEIAK